MAVKMVRYQIQTNDMRKTRVGHSQQIKNCLLLLSSHTQNSCLVHHRNIGAICKCINFVRNRNFAFESKPKQMHICSSGALSWQTAWKEQNNVKCLAKVFTLLLTLELQNSVYFFVGFYLIEQHISAHIVNRRNITQFSTFFTK